MAKGRIKTGNLAAVFVALLVIGGVFGARHYITSGALGGKGQESSVPQKVALLSVHDVAGNVAPAVELPGQDLGCTDKPEVRKEVMAWNAQMGELFATGGKQATKGSLMCQHGINYKVIRQDDCGKMQADLVTFARELSGGSKNPKNGTHYVAIMGDGAAQFLAGVNPELEKIGKEYVAEVIGSSGYSRGEDKLMGPVAWKTNAQTAKGATIAGVLRDGDWNIAMQWEQQNELCNNPDEKTYDPNCVNWIAANDFLDAGEKYIAGYCEDRPVVYKGQRTGQTKHICVDGVVTWTPGDVNIAEKKGGLVSIVSTKEYSSQMPNTIIGIRAWDRANRGLVESMLTAIFEGGDQVRLYPAALERAGEASAQVYGEKDGAYWIRYYKGTREIDKTQNTVDLGGSKANGLADNLVLFGLQKGYANAFAATYTEFGNLVVQQYKNLIPSYPPVNEVLDTSYIQAIAQRTTVMVAPEVPQFYASETPGSEVSHRSWHFEFDYAKASIKPESKAELDELARTLTVAGNTIVRIDGYTDNRGDVQKNVDLSEHRAFSVRDFLTQSAPASFPPTRFRVAGHGKENPVDTNSTDTGRSKNRRVEITVLDHN